MAASVKLEIHGAQAAGSLVPVVREIFAAVFAEPPYCEGAEDVAHWLEDYAIQRTRPGFALVLVRFDEVPVGFAYGYTMTPDMSRWQKIVEPIAPVLPIQAIQSGRIFTLMEFAVRTERRGSGLGRALYDEVLRGRTEPLALLTVREDADAAQAAYRNWGWRKVGYRPRQNAPGYDVLIRDLPAP